MNSFNFRKMIFDLLFWKRRKLRILAWLYQNTKILRRIDSEFSSFVTDTEYCLSYGPMVIQLEFVLNQKIPQANGTIFIENITPQSNFDNWLFEIPSQTYYLYWLSQNEGTPKYDFWLNENTSSLSYDFIVWAPFTLQPQETLIRAWVNKFKLAGKTYTVLYFQ